MTVEVPNKKAEKKKQRLSNKKFYAYSEDELECSTVLNDVEEMGEYLTEDIYNQLISLLAEAEFVPKRFLPPQVSFLYRFNQIDFLLLNFQGAEKRRRDDDDDHPAEGSDKEDEPMRTPPGRQRRSSGSRGASQRSASKRRKTGGEKDGHAKKSKK